jgi:nitronate monooxygenase
MTFRETIATRLRLPVIGAPMFTVSGPELVIAQCCAGIIGSFPSLNARPPEELETWLTQIETALSGYRQQHPAAKVAPYGVNLIVNATNERLEHDFEVCARHKVPLIITSLSAPTAIAKRAHEFGGTVLHDITTIRHAEKALEAGVDGLILVCAGAGGHAGTYNPIALATEVRRFFDGPLVLSGTITSGAAVLAAEALGCDLAYIGTLFIATHESRAVDRYKQMIVESAAKDIIYTPLFSGVPGSYLAHSVTAAGLDPHNLPQLGPDEKNRLRSRENRPKTWKEIWGAGQGVGNIDSVASVAEVVDRLEREYRAARARLLG